MQALTFHGIQDIRYESCPDPAILADTDVIVKVQHTAICGSDLHVYHGRERGLDAGTVMGHEFAGEIVERGKAVAHLRIGDQVVSPFTTNCGTCYYCQIGLTCRCEQGQFFGWVENGQGLQGAQAEYVRVPLAESSLVRFGPDLPAEQALLTGDIMATGYFCADQAEIKPDGTYVVLGCGPVGLMAILGAKANGAEQIYAVDTIPERLAWARQFGAIPIDFQATNPVEQIRAITAGRGADAIMEAVGSPQAGKLAYDLVRPGGIISTVGMHTAAHFSFSPVDAYNKNLTYKIGRCPARFYMEKLMQDIRKGHIDLSPFVSRHMSLKEGTEAYARFDRKEPGYLKVMLGVE